MGTDGDELSCPGSRVTSIISDEPSQGHISLLATKLIFDTPPPFSTGFAPQPLSQKAYVQPQRCVLPCTRLPPSYVTPRCLDLFQKPLSSEEFPIG